MANYWERRKALQMWQRMEDAEKVAKEIANYYGASSWWLQNKISGIYNKFKTKHHLTDEEALRLLNKAQDKNSINELKRLIQNSSIAEKEALIAELESPAYASRIRRLEEMQALIDENVTSIYKHDKQNTKKLLKKVANDSYYEDIYDIQSKTGVAFSFHSLDAKMVDKLLNSKWYGQNYSSRIWNNTLQLSEDLKRELMISFLTGRTESEVATIIRDRYQKYYMAARRLVRTESAHISSEMDAMAYEECGITHYMFCATLDLRTSEMCREHDGKIYKLSEKKEGINYPPLHPWCRSTTIEAETEEELKKMQRRARDPETGENYIVPANTTYSEWYDGLRSKYGDDKLQQFEADAKKPRYNDFNTKYNREQFERYQNILGDLMPKMDMEEFVKMKSERKSEWEDLKKKYRIVNQYHNETESPMKPSIIYELHNDAFRTKREDFSSRYKRNGNIGIMKIGDKVWYAHSSASEIGDAALTSFKGDKEKLIILPTRQHYRTIKVDENNNTSTEGYDRKKDSEAKLLEEVHRRIVQGEKIERVELLSEKPCCPSCKLVIRQFRKEHPDVILNIVSTKEDRYMKAKMASKETKGYIDEWQRKDIKK